MNYGSEEERKPGIMNNKPYNFVFLLQKVSQNIDLLLGKQGLIGSNFIDLKGIDF